MARSLKRSILWCLLFAFAAALTGAGWAQDKPVTITFAEAMASGTQKPALATLVKEFESAHPNVTVKLLVQPNYSTLYTKTLAMVAAGTPPTIAQAYEGWAQRYADSNAIIPLEPFIHGKNGLSEAELSSLWPPLIKDMQLQDGKTWMLPFNKSDFVAFYNADWLARVGMKPPKTWADFVKVAESVTSKSDNTWATSIDPGSKTGPANGTYVFVALLRAYGGHVFQNGKVVWDSPAGVQALTLLSKLVDQGAVKIGTNYPGQTALGAQRAAFDFSTIAGYPYIVNAVGGKFTMKVAAMPEGPAGPGNVLQGTNIVLFAKATQAQRDAAWSFMKFLIQPKQTAYWAEQTGYLPVTKDALPLMKDYLDKHPYQRIAANSLANALPTPSQPHSEEMFGYLSSALQSVFVGHADPQKALTSAAHQAQALVGTN
jgi:multiple sugar transport system substrate-binding protein